MTAPALGHLLNRLPPGLPRDKHGLSFAHHHGCMALANVPAPHDSKTNRSLQPQR